MKHTKKKEVVECWRQHFSRHLNVVFPHDEDALDGIEVQPEEEEEGANREITFEEVKSALQYMKLRKAPGVDDIMAKVLRAGDNNMVRVLHAIINKVWKEEVTPTDWAKMVVPPVYKKGDPLDPKNYRAIALQLEPGKVFWRAIGERMKPKIRGNIEQETIRISAGTRHNRCHICCQTNAAESKGEEKTFTLQLCGL